MADHEQHLPDLPLAAAAQEMGNVCAGLNEQLKGSTHQQVRDLVDGLARPRESDAVTIVFVGQHDAGKSSLLRCLTGRRDIAVGAGPTTSRSTTYDWSGHQLIDTPGVRAGVNESHDAITRSALALADVVVFVLTVEGLDDVIADYFLEVRQQLRTLSQLVIVVNKAFSERSERSEVEAGIATAIGPVFDMLPRVWTDAKSWLEADKYPDPLARRGRSGIDELAQHLTEITRSAGGHVRLMTPLRQWSDVAQQAVRLISADTSADGDDDLVSLDTLLEELAAQREKGMRSVLCRADEAMSELVNGLNLAGPDVEHSTLEGLVQRAADVFDERLAADGAERDKVLSTTHPVGEGSQTAGLEKVGNSGLDVASLLRNTLRQFSNSFTGAGARPGGAAHAMVTNLWHSVGGKFRPWGAVKATQAIGKAAGRANIGIAAAQTGFAVWTAHKESAAQGKKAGREAEWPHKARRIAEETVAPWREAAQRGIEELHQLRSDEVARRRLRLLVEMSADDDKVRQLADIDERISNLLQRLARGASAS